MAETVTIIVLGTALVIAPILAGGFGVIGASTVEMLIGVGGMAFAMSLWRRRLAFPAAGWGLAALVVLAALSMLHTESLYQSLRLLLLLFSYLLAFLMAANVLGPCRKWIVPATALAAAGLGLSALGVREFTTGPGAGWRVFATFANPNYFSGFLVMALPITIALYLAVKERAAAIPLAVAVALEVAALTLTAARFGIFAGGFGVLSFLALALFARSLDSTGVKRILIVALLTVPLLVVATRPVARRISGSSTQAHSLQFRLYTWEATARMALAHPVIGTGAGTFEIAFPRYAIAGYTRAAHQTFLQAASEMGFAAPLVLMFSLGAVGWTLARRVIADGRACAPYENDREGRTRMLLVAAILGGLLASGARNLVDSDWYVPALGLTFWIIAGWGVAAASGQEPTGRRAKIWPIVLGAISILLLALSADLLAGGAYARAGEKALELSDLQAAISAYGRAIDAVPMAADYYLALGRLQPAGADDPEGAIRTLRRAESLEPTRARYPYTIGMVLASEGRYPEALREMRRAVPLDPHAPRVRLDLARLYQQMGRESQAMEQYKHLAEDENSLHERVKGVPELVEPSYAWANWYLSAAAIQRKQFKEAIRYLEDAADRLERRRKAADMIQAAQAAGLANPEDEESVRHLLIACHIGLAGLYGIVGDPVLSGRHEERATVLRKEKPLSGGR